MTFEERAKVILRAHDDDEIEDFLKELDIDYISKIGRDMKGLHYFPASNPVVKYSSKALYALRRMIDSPMYCMSTKELTEAIKSIETTLQRNDKLRTKGRAIKLTMGELEQLGRLKKIFRKHFSSRSDHYNQGTILYYLGEKLIGKSLPNGTDMQIQTYCKDLKI